MSIRIMLADDHILMLEALAETLKLVSGFDVVGMAGERSEIVPTALRTVPKVAILSVSGAGQDGLDLAVELRHRLPSCGIALAVAEPTRGLVDRAIAVGVLSVIPKRARLPYLVNAIRGVAAGCLIMDSALLCEPRPGSRNLSDRETEILRLAATGASVKEIAKELFLATGTVRNLASTAIKKLGARNRFDAARIANERGWL